MKKKLKKSLACLLATLLIFSAVPMSALADEAAAPVTVTDEITAVELEEAAAKKAAEEASQNPETVAKKKMSIAERAHLAENLDDAPEEKDEK